MTTFRLVLKRTKLFDLDIVHSNEKLTLPFLTLLFLSPVAVLCIVELEHEFHVKCP